MKQGLRDYRSPFVLSCAMDEGRAEPFDDLIARVDPDRYVAALFAPGERRSGLMALYAFDHEVARIAEIVHEPMVGHIRLGWWREQIATIYAGGVVHAPAARGLAEIARAHALPRDLFESYINARAYDFEETAFADEAAMERYAVAVSGGIMQLGARVLGCEGRADGAARHAGIVHAYARILSTLGADARRRHCKLPLGWLEEAGLNPEDVFAGEMTAALRGVVARLAKAGEAAGGRLRLQSFPVRATPVLAYAALSRRGLRRPFGETRALPSWQRVARIALANLTWRI